MKRSFSIKQFALTSLMALTLNTVTAPPARSAELFLPDVPLFLDLGVQPNIFFMLDDSGSMNSEILLNTGASGTDEANLDLTPNDVQERKEFCVGHNVLAYDPNTRYTPWEGKDKTNTVYADADTMETGGFGQIRFNPYCPAADTGTDCDDPSNNGVIDLANTLQLTVAYFPWVDADGDGAFDAGECSESSISNGVTFVALPSNGTANVPGAEQQRNYANWFSYYRKREYVVKRAVSALIKKSQKRIGTSSLHNNRGIGTPIEDMDDITQPVNPTAAANKAALLRNLSRVRSTGGTPLRQGLEDVGQYFQGTTSGNWQTALFGGSPNHDINETVSALSPIFNDANGGNCQQHFTILMSDGFWNGAAPTRGNADGDGDTAFDGPPYADTGSNTLGDVAMYYYERDLRGDLANDVPTVTGVDENDAQHMVTFTVAFGLEGTLDPFDTKTPGDPTDTDPNDAGFIGWPIPPAAGNDPTTLDDMFHAAFNGRGLFLSAKKPGQVQTALQAALDTAIARTASASAVGLNSGSLDANSRLYQARFNSGNWTGQLLAFDIDQNTGAIITPELWDAGVELNAKVDVDTDLDGDNDGWTDRTIITFDGAAGIPFRWTNIVTAGMDGDLNKDGQGIPDSLGQEQGQQRLQYLRGSDEHEGRGNNYRVRAGILGDIVNAAPVFVGKPAFNYPDNLEASGETYSTFRSNNTPPSRTPMVYVGANDGMVHGFNADTGEELIGYVPKKVLPNLTRLTALNYSHRFYVDGPPTVGDVFFGTTWHTVLVGGLRNGGQGIYALDVTNPAPTNFSEANASGLVLWEFTDANDADLGFTYSRPAIVRMHNNRWAAVFGNGYNNTVADGNASITGHAVLYIVDVENGTLIRKIDTLAGSTTTPNGLPTVSPVDVDGDRTVDLIYAGDLEGNLWKFNVTNSDPANWGIAFGGSPLFVATDDGGVPQPITTRPEVGLHPKADRDGFIVYFGTGKYLESSDNDTASAQTQTFYGIWDPNKLTAPGYSRTTNLLRQDITNEIQVDATTEARITTDNQITWAADPLGLQAGEHLGWYMDLINVGATPLDNRGERQVTTPVLRGDRIIFTTLIPAGSPCLFGGDGFLMELDTNDGSRLSGAPFDFDEDGVFDKVDVGGGTFVVPSGVRSTAGAPSSPGILDAGDGKEYKYISGTDQAAIQVIHEASNPQGPPSGNRESWRQLQ